MLSDSSVMIVSHHLGREGQAVTDRDNRVVLYAVTTLSEDFKPTFRFWRINSHRSITLGSSRFSDASLRPTQCYACVYANGYEYHEAHNLAGPGDYQTMILANNYMGLHP